MKVCQSCGHKNNDQNNFCEQCANPLNNENVQPLQPNSEVPQQPINVNKAKPKKKSKKGLWITAIIILFIAAAVSAIGDKVKENTSIEAGAPQESAGAATADKKAAVGEQDKALWEYYNNIVDAHNKMLTAMGNYSEGKTSKLDFYNFCKEIKQYQTKMSNLPPKNVPDIPKDYVRSITDAAFISQQTAEKILKYLDSNKTSDLSDAQEKIKLSQESVAVVTAKRVGVLTDAGYSVDEIKALAK